MIAQCNGAVVGALMGGCQMPFRETAGVIEAQDPPTVETAEREPDLAIGIPVSKQPGVAALLVRMPASSPEARNHVHVCTRQSRRYAP